MSLPGPTQSRPLRSAMYPWYDSVWLSKYRNAMAIIRRVKPDALPHFIETMRVFETRPDFGVATVDHVFDEDIMREIRHVVASLRPSDLKIHEARTFGRFVVHDHPFFTELQQRTVPLVSEAVGEPVEPKYNFLSLYSTLGVCPLHMDSPEAKWTLDLCVDQSVAWPIHFSDVIPWPAPDDATWQDDAWDSRVKESPSVRFSSHTLEPGQAVIFSGSSQWHYRDAIPEHPGRQFCDLLFFHFVPAGTSELVRPRNWARLFGIPELSELSGSVPNPTGNTDAASS